jgi:hypothetical protein
MYWSAKIRDQIDSAAPNHPKIIVRHERKVMRSTASRGAPWLTTTGWKKSRPELSRRKMQMTKISKNHPLTK